MELLAEAQAKREEDHALAAQHAAATAAVPEVGVAVAPLLASATASATPPPSPSPSPSSLAPRSVRQLYPVNVTVDFTKLRTNALRRYMAFHGIQEIPGSSKEQLAIVVARHFNDECQQTDEETSIASFLSYLKGSRLPETDGSDTDSSGRRRSLSQDALSMDKENDRQYSNAAEDVEMQEDSHDSSDEEPLSRIAVAPTKKRKAAPATASTTHRSNAARPSPTSSASSSSSSSHHTSGGGTNGRKKKKRKTRLYCVCKGSSFGDMIACDNKKCLDRSNWYHMDCVGLESSGEPPETWYCPSCQDHDPTELPENQYRKPVASVTYGDMISHALTVMPNGKGSFKEICDFVEKQYESQLNWKLESDQRKSPVWKSSVRKILFSNVRFRKHPDDKGLFCLAA